MTADGGPSGGDARATMGGGDLRQVRNQFNQLANQGQDLRRQLQQAGGQPQDLKAVDDMIKSLRALGGEGSVADIKGMQELSASTLDKLRKFDLDLRKRVDSSNDQLFLSGNEDTPAKYRGLVDEYYRALSKKTGSGARAETTGAAPGK